MPEARYAVRESVLERIEGFAVDHPDTGLLVSNRSFPNGYCHQPKTWSLDEAQRVAAQLAIETGVFWVVELAPVPCIRCGRIIWADDRDFCYPSNRERTTWRAGCDLHNFGCGHEVLGDSFDDVMRRWNAGE